MASRIEHRAAYPNPASTVHSALIDKAFLDERLRVLGGKNAALLEYSVDGDTVSFRLRQGVDAAKLPPVARTVLKGDLIVERAETWRSGSDYTGTTKATIPGVPAEIAGTFLLTDTPAGSEWFVDASVKVSIPLIGGKIESVVAEQVRKLVAAEAELVGRWLAEH